MPKYKISFSGFAYIEAEDCEEAEEIFYNDGGVYSEYEIDEAEEVDEFRVGLI